MGRTDAETEALILWPPDANSWLTEKDSDARKDWRQKKRIAEDEMVRLHHWLSGQQSEQTLGDSEGQESMTCCNPQDRKESDRTKQLKNKVWH